MIDFLKRLFRRRSGSASLEFPADLLPHSLDRPSIFNISANKPVPNGLSEISGLSTISLITTNQALIGKPRRSTLKFDEVAADDQEQIEFLEIEPRPPLRSPTVLMSNATSSLRGKVSYSSLISSIPEATTPEATSPTSTLMENPNPRGQYSSPGYQTSSI